MKKLFAVLFSFVVVFIEAGCQAQEQKDYYGTWVWLGKNDNYKMTYVISERTVSSTFNGPLFSENTSAEILSWRKIANENADTKTGYPAGFELELRFSGGAGLEQLYIHRNKRSIINSVGDLLVKQTGPAGEGDLGRTGHTQEYDLCLGVLQGDLAMVEAAIKRGANVNLLDLKDGEARTIRREFLYWCMKFDDTVTEEEINRQFENPPRSVDLDHLNLSELPGSILSIAVLNDNADIARALLESGISTDTSFLIETLNDESTPLSEPMRTLFMGYLQKQH
jgi:hypothetical protein